MTMSEKNTPIDSAEPELANVIRIPDAAPRCAAGTLFMITEALGELNIPEPTPLRKVSPANATYGKSTGSSMSPRNDTAVIAAPPTANLRAPCRSLSQPETGPATRNPAVSGNRKMLAHSGVLAYE